MSKARPLVKLGEVLSQRKEVITIDDTQEYMRCRVQLHAKGIVLRDRVTGSEIKTKQQQICRAGEFLVAEIDAKVGGFGIVPDELEDSIASSHYFLFTIDSAKLNKKFLDYYSKTPAFREQVNAKGSTNYAAIRPHEVLNYIIPLPPLAEQQRIVAKIERLAGKIEEARKIKLASIHELDLFWPSFLNEVFTGKYNLRKSANFKNTAEQLLEKQAKKYAHWSSSNSNNAHPNKPKILKNGPFNLPIDWIWTTLGSVLTHFIDCVNDTPDFADYDTGLLGLKSTNIKPYKFDIREKWYVTPNDFNSWNRREEPKAGDIILTREAPMGQACRLPDNYKVCLTQRLMLLRSDLEFINSEFLLHYINSSYFREQVLNVCRGLTTPHIRVKDAPNFFIPLPPIEQQNYIVHYLGGLKAQKDKLVAFQAQTTAELDALLPSILDKAFKGEL